MKLKDLSNLIIFDEFPLLFEPKQKIIITHLLHLEKQTLPEKLPMIFTTEKLSHQLKTYCEATNRKCINKSNVIVVKPYEFIDIVLERRLTLQILFCATEVEECNNVLVLIRQNGKLNFIYGGNYTDIRSAVLNDTFASWVMHGVEKLYVNLKRMDENHTFSDVDQMEKVFQNIEKIIMWHPNSKLHIYLPLFGYEHFIIKLAQRLPQRIKLLNLTKFYMHLPNDDDDDQISTTFITDSKAEEKIILFVGQSTLYEAHVNFEDKRIVTVNIFDNVANSEITSVNTYYELLYSPEPSPFQLKLLCMLVKPKRIFGIIDTFNNKSIVPKYLYELCVGAKEKILKSQEKKLNNSNTLSGTSTKPTKIVLGGLPNNTPKKSGTYLTDSESDDE